MIVRKYNSFVKTFIYFWAILINPGFSQNLSDIESFKVDSVYITGNAITKDFVILRELTFQAGDTVNRGVLKYNRERIYSLGIFNTVELKRELLEENNSINIIVEEGWYLWPIPFVDFKDNDFKKISAGMDLRLENFQGINDDLRLRFALGYDPEATLTYVLPYIWTDPDISFESITTYGTYRNNDKLYENFYGEKFDYKTIKHRVGFGYRLSLYSRIYYYSEFMYNQLPHEIIPVAAGNTNIYRILSNSVKYWYDSRDLKQFPQKGSSLQLEYAYKIGTTGDIAYSNIYFDFRTYNHLFAGINYRYRLFTRQSAGNVIPSFDLAYIGFTDYVRANFSEKLQGKNSYLTSLELTKDLITEWIIDFDFPMIPSSLQTFRTALIFETFFDAGTVAESNADLIDQRFQAGTGIGLVFMVLPYDLLRVEYGINNYQKTEFKVDIGLSF